MKSGECLDAAAPFDVLQQERGQKEIRSGLDRRPLDVVFKDGGGQAVLRQALCQAHQECRVQVGEGQAEWPEDGGVGEIERLPGARADDHHATAHGRIGHTKNLAGEVGGRLSLADSGHVLVVILARDDLSPGAAETGVHL